MPDDVTFIDFFGERFAVPQRINQRLVIRFSRLAAEGADTEDVDEAKATEAAILLDRMVEQVVRPEDKDRFEDVCDRERPSDEELMKFVADVLSAVSRRPTSRPSVSSGGQASTTSKSESVDTPSLQLVKRLEEQGRADKAEFVAMAMQASSAS